MATNSSSSSISSSGVGTFASNANDRKFRKELEEMMFGFGDSWPPNKDTTTLMEILTKQYIEDLCQQARQMAELRGKLDADCFLFLMRKDPRKHNRLLQLLQANEELKKAKSIPEITDLMTGGSI